MKSKHSKKAEVQHSVARLLAESFGQQTKLLGHFESLTLDPFEAYELSAINGAAYLNNVDFPISVRPFSKLFGAAHSLELTSGMFDRGIDRYTPEKLCAKYPFLSIGRKTVVPVAFDSEQELSEIRSRLFETAESPQDLLILRIENWKKGFGLESLLEYLAARVFMAHGYIVENQAPVSATVGSPDFLAFRLASLNQDLLEVCGISPGQSLIGLALRNEIPQVAKTLADSTASDYVTVGEAKVGGASGSKQLDKYMATGYFDNGVFITDSLSSSSSRYAQLSTAFHQRALEYPFKEPTSPTKASASYRKWLEVVALSYLYVGLPATRRENLRGALGLRGGDEGVPTAIAALPRIEFLESFMLASG